MGRRGATRIKGWSQALGALACGVVSTLTPGAVAKAQVALEQFKPAPLASDGFALSRPDTLRAREWGTMLLLDYANDPLVYETSSFASDQEEVVVAHHLVAHLGLAVGLGTRVTVFGMLPVHVLMAGDTDLAVAASEADGPGLGDLALGGRVMLAGDSTSAFGLSAEFIARVPTAQLANDNQVYSGDKIGSYEPAMVAEGRFGRFDLRGRGGARLRKKTDVGNLELGQELLYGVGARLRIVAGLYGHAELYGGTTLNNFGKREQSPLEVLLGAKYQVTDWSFGAAAGPGLVAGYGSPDVRIIGTLGYAPVAKKAPPAPKDTDGDGLLDPDDKCPLEPEDKDGFEDSEGCPDPDNDKDGVLDVSDQCVMEPEDTDGFEDANGCPDPDNDKDGLLDVEDQCPLDPEDKDDFLDLDGCPDPDNDRDTVLDVDDECPLEPGAPDAKGCPKSIRIDVEKGQIMILDRVEFATNKDVILEKSTPILDEVALTLKANPQLVRLRVEGHTDNVGKPKKNVDLSMRRARSVVRWLVENGIPITRFEAYGCGPNLPIAENTTAEGKQQNRRVEFHIIDPAPPEPRSTEGCTVIPIE